MVQIYSALDRGAAVGALAATVINSVIRSRYSKEHEKEADRIGTELALARGFDPEEAVRFWERQHERFGKRSLSPKIANSLFGSHPQDRVRAENLRALLAADLKSAIDDKRTGGGLVTGTPRFGNVISGIRIQLRCHITHEVLEDLERLLALAPAP